MRAQASGRARTGVNRTDCLRHRPCPFRRSTGSPLHDLRLHSLAPSSRTAQRRGEGESPDAAGVFRPGREVAALHLRAAVLRAGRRPADGRDRREIARNRAADRLVHRHGAGAAIVGAAQDVRRNDVHRQPRLGVDDPRARSGARRSDGRRARGIGHRRAARLDARHRADRRAEHARHRSDQEARHAARARRADHAAGAHGHQRLRRHHRRQHHCGVRRRSADASQYWRTVWDQIAVGRIHCSASSRTTSSRDCRSRSCSAGSSRSRPATSGWARPAARKAWGRARRERS